MSKILVQFPKGTSSVSVDGHHYTPDKDGIVELVTPAHVAPLRKAGGIEVDEHGGASNASTLAGTEIFPPLVELNPDEDPRPLADIVAETHAKIAISVDEWNNLPQRVRDILIGYTVAVARGEIGDTRAEVARRQAAEAEADRLRDVADLHDGLVESLDKLRVERDGLQGDLQAANDRIAALETAAKPAEPKADAEVEVEGKKAKGTDKG